MVGRGMAGAVGLSAAGAGPAAQRRAPVSSGPGARALRGERGPGVAVEPEPGVHGIRDAHPVFILGDFNRKPAVKAAA